jgi:glycosyltransferase involved in cell wall biosynthesis
MKLSIITVNLNNKKGLQKTIESVVCQMFSSYEYIVIDGGSTDGSVDVIKQFADKITYWVSEPDKGIYNAMNKGILQAKGEYCLFLNSGDWLIEKSGLQQVFDKNLIEDIIYCDIETSVGNWRYPDEVSLFSFFLNKTIGHPASFIKKSIFHSEGLYNEKEKIISDWEFFLIAIIEHKCSYRHIELFLTHFDLTGISMNKKNKSLQIDNRRKFLRERYPMVYDDYLLFSEMNNEVLYYRNSKLVQFVKKIQESKLYKIFRRII